MAKEGLVNGNGIILEIMLHVISPAAGTKRHLKRFKALTSSCEIKCEELSF